MLAEVVAELKKANEKLEAIEEETKAAESKLSVELKKANEKLEIIQKATQAAEVKLNFIEGRSDTFTAHSHDRRRHIEQMKEEIVQAKTYEEKRDSKQNYVAWKKATFWMIFQHSALRAFGFLVEEVCSN